jgi:pyrroloquinoline quinone biosynthesis protein D
MQTTMIGDDARPRLARGVRLQMDAKTGKSVLLYPEGILELNETAQEILTRCSGATVAEIACELSEQYEADVATIALEIRETIADLHQRKLIELA